MPAAKRPRPSADPPRPQSLSPAERALQSVVYFCPRTVETYATLSAAAKVCRSTRSWRRFAVYSTRAPAQVSWEAAYRGDRLTLTYLGSAEFRTRWAQGGGTLEYLYSVAAAAAYCGYADLVEAAYHLGKLAPSMAVFRCLARCGNLPLLQKIVGPLLRFEMYPASFTLVSAAAAQGDLAMITFLIARGAPSTRFAVICAQKNGYPDVAAYLERDLT